MIGPSTSVIFFFSFTHLQLPFPQIVMNMKETLAVKEKLHKSMFYIGRTDIIDIGALPAGIITFFSYTAYGLILTLIPDWSEHLGAENKGIFFTSFTAASVLVRFGAGKVSDRYGRTSVILFGLIVTAFRYS